MRTLYFQSQDYVEKEDKELNKLFDALSLKNFWFQKKYLGNRTKC